MTKSEIVLKAKEYAETSRLIIDEHTKIIDKQSFIAGANHVLARAEKLAEAASEVQCECTVKERESGHRVECAMPQLQEALREWSKP